MKKIFYCFLLCNMISVSCTTQGSEKELRQQITSDSLSLIVVDIMAHKNNDTIALMKALGICDSMLEMKYKKPDGYEKSQIDFESSRRKTILTNKSYILQLLNRQTDAFILKNEIVDKDENSIDRLIYNGEKQSLLGNRDSSYHYFSKAIDLYKIQSRDKFDFDLLVKRLEIFYWSDQPKEAIAFLDSLKSEESDSTNAEILEVLINIQSNEIWSAVKDFRDKIKPDQLHKLSNF